MKNLCRILWLVCLMILVGSGSVFGTATPDRDYWPGDTWRTSTPEEQGMDSERIYRMLKLLQEGRTTPHSVMIIRNGYIVTEAYFEPYHRESKQNIETCTKSVTSALIGIAIGQGLIRDVHQKVVDFFPEYSFANISEGKKAITIENLLTMTSGLDWVWPKDDIYFRYMLAAEDSVQYMLDLRMTDNPGDRFNYSTGVSQLLAAIISKTSGTTVFNFAKENLFEPMGIDGADWQTDPKGIHLGGTGLYLTPTEMAKFGYLYLRWGFWKEKQLVPAEWVETSIKTQIHDKLSPNSPIVYDYHWWNESFGFAAQGWGGQSIYVIPKFDMVVVFTNGKPIYPLFNADLSSLLEMYLLPAVKSDRPLPRNPKMANQIKSLLRDLETPKAKPVPALPRNAAQISEKIVDCEFNNHKFKSWSLRFGSKNSCTLQVTWDNGWSFEYPVGLDGVYRTSVTEVSGPEALKGAWVSENEFVINWQILREPERNDFHITFDGQDASIEVASSMMRAIETIRGKLH